MNDWLRYRSSRFPSSLYFPLAILLCTAAYVSIPSVNAASLGLDLLLAYSLLFQFRLWDDLHDVTIDRVEHPQRVLSQATSLTHFQLLLGCSFLVNVGIVALVKPVSSLVILLSLDAIFLIGYGRHGNLRSSWRFCYYGLLLKYPVFVYLLSSGTNEGDWVPLACAMAVVYLSFCVYEILHDEKRHTDRGATTLLGVEMVTLAAIASWMLFRQTNTDASRSWLQAILTLGSCGIMVVLYQRHRNHIAPGRWCYTVFLLCFLWLLDCVVINSVNLQAISDMRVPQ